MPNNLGRVIAERQLKIDSTERLVVVRLGAPKKDNQDWACPYQILGLGRRAVRRAFGVDSVQALVMALESIRQELAGTDRSLTWLGGHTGDTGFGPIVHSFIGPSATRRLEKMIEREANRYLLRGIASRKKRRSLLPRRSTK